MHITKTLPYLFEAAVEYILVSFLLQHEGSVANSDRGAQG